MHNYLIACLIISAYAVVGFILLGISVALINHLWPDTLNNNTRTTITNNTNHITAVQKHRRVA